MESQNLLQSLEVNLFKRGDINIVGCHPVSPFSFLTGPRFYPLPHPPLSTGAPRSKLTPPPHSKGKPEALQCDSQLKVTLHPRNVRQCRGIYWIVTTRGKSSTRQRPRVLQNILPYAGQSSTTENYPTRTPMVH